MNGKFFTFISVLVLFFAQVHSLLAFPYYSDFTREIDTTTSLRFGGTFGIATSDSSYGTPTDVLLRIPSTTIDKFIRTGLGAIMSDGGCSANSSVQVTIYGYGLGTSSSALGSMSTTTNGTCAWRVSTTTPLCLTGCDVRVQSSGGIAVMGQTSELDSGVYFYYPVGTIIDTTKQPKVWIESVGTIKGTGSGGSTTTIPLYTPLLKDRLTSMNCTYSATSTNCVPQYASTTIPITPENVFFSLTIFMAALVLMYWIVRKLTH